MMNDGATQRSTHAGRESSRDTKFLRQNRDIAKINSDQSQKIRRLENDCARLLSENLELRGQILRLEKQVEDNSARRIADHALEVKAKLEVQLSEFAALLGSLGVEPPFKRRSSGDRRLSKPRQSMTRSPPQRRRRNTSIDSEALAEMEGRLPPIYENKTYPRATMGSDEIMALCAAAEDVNDSSDLGPPPVSRYVEDFSVMNSPTKPLETYVQESPRRPQTVLSPPQPDQTTTSSDSPEICTDADEAVVKESSPRKQAPAKEPASEPSSQTVRPSVKRKYGDEDGLTQSVAPIVGKENDVPAKSFPTRNGPKRSLAEMANAKPEKKTTKAPLSAKRTPLAAKSTNEDVSSPRKVAKSAPLKDIKKEKEHQGALSDSVMQGEGNAPKPPVEIIIPADHNLLETATSLPSATPSSPTTPPRPAQREVLTPPPADISSTGETTRPTRRARAAVSYVEPNLRDKMRRPTKELFDAVSGEGKYAHRTAVQAKDGHHSAPTSVSKVKPEPGSSTGGSSKTISVSDRAPLAQQPALLSPLAQKDVLPESLPNTVVMERRKRMSAVGGNRASLAAQGGPDNADREPSPVIVARPEGATQTSSSRHKVSVSKASIDNQQTQSPPSATEVDIYDFTASSPAVVSSTKPSAASGGSESRPTSSHPAPTSQSNSFPNSRQRTARKSSMAAAAALREILDEEEHDAESKPPRPQAPPKSRAAHGGRKRASMLAPKKSSMLLDEGSEDFGVVADADTSGTSTEGDSGIIGNGSGRDAGRISRRRSMML